ncbi:hypothetical protein C8R47DRAFT_1166293 [Mycena vitilis]|nr:hypothetical protein C8R47DRAFT_1166293 [Mycena vitilis]
MPDPVVDAPLSLSDRPLPKKLLDELKSIANAMGLDADLRKDVLLRSIQRHIQSAPEIADDPRFLPLFAHRSNPKGGSKSSAGKAAEEDAESSKPQLPATGANKTLLVNEVKMDPPPQFEKLSSGKPKQDTSHKAGAVDDDGSDSSEGLPPSTAATPEPEETDVKVGRDKRVKGVVQVNFFDESGRNGTPRSVIVDEVPVAISTLQDGHKKYSTLLSKLIPAAIQNDSPIKDRGGRLYRRDVRPNEPGYHQLGKIDALLAGTAGPLRAKIVDEYTLRTGEDDTFFCDLYWDELPGLPAGSESVQIAAEQPAEGSKPIALTGAGSDVPLDIANERALNDPMHKNAAPALRALFARWVHGKIQESVEIPDFGEEWARCMFGGQMLDRHLLQEAAIEFLTLAKWGRTHGGFAVPRGLVPYVGVKFEKKFLLEEALNIKTSSTADIDKYFTPEALEKAPKARAWVMSKGVEHNDRFRKMKSARFKEYVQQDHRKRKLNKVRRRRSSSGSAGPSRKSRKSAASSSEEENVRRGKGKGRMTEENMDDSD